MMRRLGRFDWINAGLGGIVGFLTAMLLTLSNCTS